MRLKQSGVMEEKNIVSNLNFWELKTKNNTEIQL